MVLAAGNIEKEVLSFTQGITVKQRGSRHKT